MFKLTQSGIIAIAILTILGCGGGGDKSKEKDSSQRGNIDRAIIKDAKGQIAKSDTNGLYSFKTPPTHPITIEATSNTQANDKELLENIKCSTIKTDSKTYANDNSECKTSTTDKRVTLELRQVRSIDLQTITFALVGSVVTANVPKVEPKPTPSPSPTPTPSKDRSVKVVLKTGQTKCYDPNTHNEIPCTNPAAKGQDGYYQKGLARSYTRNGNIVTDNTTKLQWQDDATVKTTQKNWEEAKTHCQNLTLDGFSDWRLPSMSELLSITDLGRYNPAIDPTFQNTSSNDFWTSTTDASSTSGAWDVGFSNGSDFWDGKSNSSDVRCVRAGQ